MNWLMQECYRRGWYKLTQLLLPVARMFGADEALVRQSRGILADLRSRSDEAIDHYRAALELDDDLVLARTRLAHLLAQQGQLSEALRQAERIPSLEMDSVLALELGWLLADTKQDYRHAIEWFSLAEDLGEPVAVFGRADCLHQLGRTQEARAAYESVLANLGTLSKSRRDAMALKAKLGIASILSDSDGELTDALELAASARRLHADRVVDDLEEVRYADEFIAWASRELERRDEEQAE